MYSEQTKHVDCFGDPLLKLHRMVITQNCSEDPQGGAVCLKVSCYNTHEERETLPKSVLLS